LLAKGKQGRGGERGGEEARWVCGFEDGGNLGYTAGTRGEATAPAGESERSMRRYFILVKGEGWL